MQREHCAGQSSALQGPSPLARRLLQPELCSHHIPATCPAALQPDYPLDPIGGALRLQNSTALIAERKQQADNNPRWTGLCLSGVHSEKRHRWNKKQQLSSVRNSYPLNANDTRLEREVPPGGHVSRMTLSRRYHHDSSVPELFAFSSLRSLLPASCQPGRLGASCSWLLAAHISDASLADEGLVGEMNTPPLPQLLLLEDLPEYSQRRELALLDFMRLFTCLILSRCSEAPLTRSCSLVQTALLGFRFDKTYLGIRAPLCRRDPAPSRANAHREAACKISPIKAQGLVYR